LAFDFPAGPAPGTVYGSYTYDGEKWMMTGGATGGGNPADFVLKAGDTMTGFLTLNADPTAPLHAATKGYADSLALPLGGAVGEALVKNAANVAQWGAPISGPNFMCEWR
jgi:hypothetical protein